MAASLTGRYSREAPRHLPAALSADDLVREIVEFIADLAPAFGLNGASNPRDN